MSKALFTFKDDMYWLPSALSLVNEFSIFKNFVTLFSK